MITSDIETLPTDNQAVIEAMRKKIAPPANYTKADTIEKWMAENAEKALAEMVAKTSFDGLYGRVACIAWQHDDDEIMATDADDSERDAIARFYSYIANGSKFCGHNIAGFDLPFLKHRSIILGIKPPASIMSAMNAKPWEICDTMLMWSTDRDKRVSLVKLLDAFGIEHDDFDGSMVAEMWKTDRQKVIDYCRSDVALTRAVYKRLTFSA